VHREQIEELTHGVNNMLTLYLEVHDGMFAHPWWRSLPIPGLFKSIPYDRYEIQISKVEQILREIEGHIRALYKEATTNEKAYLSVLHQYTLALLKAVIALNPVVIGLKGKTDSKPYSVSAYNADLAKYKAVESGYHTLGKQMNDGWRAYCGPAAVQNGAGCVVHILDAVHGLRVEKWTIGERVERETYDKFKDREGRLYVVVAYEKGEPKATFVVKEMWDQVAQQFADIDSEAAASFEKAKRDFGLK
jgi:hypothetical protein